MAGFLLSVVIPALNEEQFLPACLQSIKKQAYSGPLNIIVSDNGSQDKTREIAQKEGCFIVQGSELGNIASARKLGCQKAKQLAEGYKSQEEIIINTDADTIFSPGYFQTVVKVFQDQKVAAASGPFIINNQQIPFKKMGRNLIRCHFFACGVSLRMPWIFKKFWKNSFFYGANSCLRRSVYNRVGGWDNDFSKAEDLAFTIKLLKENISITYVDQLAVSSSLRKFVDEGDNFCFSKLYNYCLKDEKIIKGAKTIRQKYR